MKKYEIAINILDKEYVDDLIVALARQGYNVYLNAEDGVVCFTATDEEVTEVKMDV
jgi:hypothetical protein